jgi:hypothetical protein
MKKVKRFVSVAVFTALALTFLSCSDGGGNYPDGSTKYYGGTAISNEIISDIYEEFISSGVIPEEIYEEFKELMPIYSGKTPPDISGEYIVTPMVLIGSSLDEDDNAIGKVGKFAALNISFVRNLDGTLKCIESQDDSFHSGDDVEVQVVGDGDYFTAYYVSSGESSGIYNKHSVLISGILDSEGIRDFHYAFIMLEKGDDPIPELVPVNTYRVFKDNDGLAKRIGPASTSNKPAIKKSSGLKYLQKISSPLATEVHNE